MGATLTPDGWLCDEITSSLGGPEVANDLVTQDATKALSALQGYILARDKLGFSNGVPTGGSDGEWRMRYDDGFFGWIYRNESGTWNLKGVGQLSQGLLNSSFGHAENITYSGGRPATYDRNGVTWTVSYGAFGPSQETGGGLTLTYNYNGSGQFTGFTGTGLNAGKIRKGTWANRPTSGLGGDPYFVTDIGKNAAGTSLGRTLEWSEGASRLVPAKAYTFMSQVSTNAAPLDSHTNANAAGSTLFTLPGGACQFPAGFLYAGARFRLTAKLTRTGAIAASSIYLKFGTAGTTADATLFAGVSFAATTNTGVRILMDINVVSATVIQISSNLGVLNTTSPASEEVSGLTLTNAYTLSIGSASVASGDTINLMEFTLEHLA